MKIAIYTIAKNEEHNVDRFMTNLTLADYVVILDTGSSDKTIEKFKKYDNVIIEQETITPFDFAVARNKALALVPKDVDVCVSIDLDEQIQPNWRIALEKEWIENTIIGSYWYWSAMDKNGNSLVECWRTKIHSRNDFRWERSIHEMIKTDRTDGGQVFIKDFVVKHFREKPSDYSKQLNEHIKNNPNDKEAYMQRAGDFVDKKMLKEANEDYFMFLKLSNNMEMDFKLTVDRAICYLSIAKNYFHLKEDLGLVQKYLLKCVGEFPNFREGWVYLAELYNATNESAMAYACSMKALSIVNNNNYVSESKCWGDYPKQLANINIQKILQKYEVVAK